MKDNRNMIVIVLTVLVILGVGIFFVFGGKKVGPEVIINTDVPEKITNTEVPEVAAVDTAVPQENEMEQSSGNDQPTETSAPVVDNVVVPTVRTGLESTNPADVNLASGNLQLIELFAFW